MERGLFFHQVYKIQQKLGKAFAELEPYPLYPVSEYFWGERLSRVEPTRPGSTPKHPIRRRAA